MSHDPTSGEGFDLEGLEKAIHALLRRLPEDPPRAFPPDVKASPAFINRMRLTLDRLRGLQDHLDPVRQPLGRIQLFAPATIGRLIGRELEMVQMISLQGVEAFHGAGVYALYYSGDHHAYEAIAGTNCPIYVGKGDAKNLRAGTPREQGRGLYTRLTEHRDSIEKADRSLKIEDFGCRYLATESGWQMTAEAFLIALYRPVWNKETKVCQGFGKHGDKARAELSKWDTLHAGREWAGHQKSKKGYTRESVIEGIKRHFLGLLEQDPVFWGKHLSRDWVKKHGAKN